MTSRHVFVLQEALRDAFAECGIVAKQLICAALEDAAGSSYFASRMAAPETLASH